MKISKSIHRCLFRINRHRAPINETIDFTVPACYQEWFTYFLSHYRSIQRTLNQSLMETGSCKARDTVRLPDAELTWVFSSCRDGCERRRLADGRRTRARRRVETPQRRSWPRTASPAVNISNCISRGHAADQSGPYRVSAVSSWGISSLTCRPATVTTRPQLDTWRSATEHLWPGAIHPGPRTYIHTTDS